MTEDVVLVDIMQELISKMKVPDSLDGFLAINFQPGRSAQILDGLTQIDNSITDKDTKYPFIGMLMPTVEERGNGYYAKVRIDRIVIAMISDRNVSVLDRYAAGGTFKKVLYPCYYEFLNQICLSTKILGQDPDNFPHRKLDNPGQKPIGNLGNDVIDSIEILNLELTLPQIKTCK